MNRIDTIFADLRAANRRALMPFLCAGRPSAASLPDMLLAMERAGASIVEVGFPFSDPIADGPVIAAAMHEALQAHITPRQILDGVKSARDKGLAIGLVAMVSVSIVQRIGAERFIADAKASGFDGFIFPDAPFDESDDLLSRVRDAGLTASMLIAPNTPNERAAAIARACSGFIYLLARVGITGERADAPEIAGRVAQLRKVTDLPIACGFGIANPDQVRAVVEHADAAIVGSALVRRIEDAIANGSDPLAAAESFVKDLEEGLATPTGA
jgi:tryptophan synthase alpha chain